MKLFYKNFFIGLLLYSLLSQSLMAGIVFDLTDPESSKSFVQAVEDANENLSSSAVSGMGSAPMACEAPAEVVKKAIPVKDGPRKAVPVNPNSEKDFIAAKDNAVIDTFQMVDEKNYTCGMFSKVDLKGPDGKKIKSVCPEFLDQLATYGLAKLDNGQVVQFSKTVKVEKTINGVKGFFWEKRFALANPNCPDGQTASGICLEPYRSIIVSKHMGFAPGDIVYFDDFRDVVIPPGVRHGGYFVVAAVKKTDESLKPEASIFIGTDSHEKNALLASVQAYTKNGLKLSKVTGESRKDAEWYINEKRQAAKEIHAKRAAEGVQAPSLFDKTRQSVTNFFDRQEISKDKESLNGEGWTSDYTEYVVDAITDQSPLMSLDTEEINLMCPRFAQMNLSEKKLFWAFFFKALTVPESGTNPYKGYVETGSTHSAGDLALKKAAGSKVDKTSEGLLQLSYQDALADIHGCDFDYEKDYPVFKHVVAARAKARSESSRFSRAEAYKRRSADLDELVAMGYLEEKHLSAAKRLEIYDPKKNLQCGVKILEDQLRIPRPLQSKNNYYWSVLNTNNSDGNTKFNNAIKKSEQFCSVNYVKPSVAKDQPVIPETAPPQGYENGNFKIDLGNSERDRIARTIAENNHGSYSPGKVEEVKKRLEKEADKIASFHSSSSYDGPAVADPTDLTNRMKILMTDLAKDPRGRYAMIDYVEFKGDGLSSNERVFDSSGNKTNVGFGLYQVLASAAAEYDGTQDPNALFAKHANLVLDNRIKIADKTPTDKNGLSKYRKEWGSRTASYGAKTGAIAQGTDRVPATSGGTPQPAPPSDPVIADLPPITVPAALASDQPFMSEGKLVWEGKFPEVNCEEWGLNGANFCFPEPGRIVLSPSHGVGDDSKRNSVSDGHGGAFFHEGHMNMSTSLVIKSAVEKCLDNPNSAGQKEPQVRLARWPGETSFGQQEFDKRIGEVLMDSHKGGRPGYVNQYLLGDGRSIDPDVADKSLLICVDYNASDSMEKNRDHSFAFPPRTTKGKDSTEISNSVSAHVIEGLYGYLETLGSNSPLADHDKFRKNSYYNAENFEKGLTMFTDVGTPSTKHLTIEGFFMNGGIGRRVASKIASDNPNNYFEFGMRRLVYDKGTDSWVKAKDPIEPKYRVTQEHLLVARGVALGIMNNKEYQCQQ